MDERRRHIFSGQNLPGMEYDINLYHRHEERNYVDHIMQRDRNEQFMERTSQSASAYSSHASGSYFGNHGHQGPPHTTWQNEARDLSHQPSMYIPQTYPSYPAFDQSRFVNSQALGRLPYCGFEGYGHTVNRTPVHPSQPFPSDGNTVDSRQSSWNDNTYRSTQTTAEEPRNYPSTYGTPGSNIDALPTQIPSEISQGTVVKNYSANSEMPVHDRSSNDSYNTAADRGSSVTFMNHGPGSVTPGPESQLTSNKSWVGLTPAQNYSADTPHSKPDSLPQAVNNFTNGGCPLPVSSQQVKDMSDVDRMQHKPHQTADHHNIGQTTEETGTEHSSPSSNEKLALSSGQDNVPTSNSLMTECIVTGDNQKECLGSQEVLEHSTKSDMPADAESVERTIKSEEITSECEREPNTKVELNDDIVQRLPELGSSRITSSDYPVSGNPNFSNTYADEVGQNFHNEEDESQQNKDSQRNNCNAHLNVKELVSKSTPVTVRTTVDLSASELGCSTVVKFEDGTCKYIKREATDEKEEETFFCSSQQDDGQVLEPKMGSCEEDNHTGIQGEDCATGSQGENNGTAVKQEIKTEQQHLEDDNAVEEYQEKVKMEVDNEMGSSTGLDRGVPDASRQSAVPLKDQGVHSVMECKYDSDDWEVGSDKQDKTGSVQLNTAPGVVDGGTFERCLQCNELISSDDMIEHPFKCKSKSNTPAALMVLPPDLRPPNDDEAVVKCPECGVGFQTTEDLVMHLRIHEMLAKNAHAQKMQEENQMMVMSEEMEKQITNFGDIAEELSGECEVCYETFTDPTMIPYHKVMHQQFPFHCRKCNLFFSTLTELHKSRCSDQKRHKVFKYRCKKCKGALLDSYKMRKHRKRCEGKMETCRLCQKKFPSFTQLAHHAEICNEDQTKKGDGDDRDHNKIGVVVEENCAEVGSPDLESVDQEHVDQASTDHETEYHTTADHKAADHTIADLKSADYKPADQAHGKNSGSKYKRTLQTENSSSNEETFEKAGREPLKKKRKKEKDGGETCGACGKWFKNFKKLEKHTARCDGVRNHHDRGACSEAQPDNEYHTTADHKAADNTTADHKAADYKPVDQAVTYDSSLGVQLDSRPVKGKIREPPSKEVNFTLGDGTRSLENFMETNLTLQPSEEYNSEVRCKVCERELSVSHRRACKETVEYCKSCLNMVRTKNLSPREKKSASKHKRTLPRENSSSNEEACENGGRGPPKKKQKREKDGGETCGACGKWFKNFEKLEKHAARCDGVRNQHDRGACSETKKDDINLDWKYPTVHRCPKCDKKFVKEKKLKKHVKSCLWIQEGSPKESNAVMDEVSDHEDELPLSALKNMNDAVGEDLSSKDSVGHILPQGTMESDHEDELPLSALKNMNDAVGEDLSSKDSVGHILPQGTMESDHEDELPLSALKNMNDAVGEDLSSKDSVGHILPHGTMESDREDELPLSALKNMNDAVGEDLSSKDSVGHILPQGTMESDREDELPLSALKNMNDAVGEDLSCKDSVGHILPQGTMESDREDELPLSALKNMNDAVGEDLSCKDSVGHILPQGTMESDREDELPLSALKNMNDAVGEDLSSKDSVGHILPQGTMESDREDELPLSALKNMNDAVGEDLSSKDSVGHILSLGMMESSESSKVELMCATAAAVKKVNKGNSDQSVSEVPKKLDEESREKGCAASGSMPSDQKDISFSEHRVIGDGAIYDQSDIRTSGNVVSASGLVEKALPQELDCDVDEHYTESKELVQEMETSQKSKCDGRVVNTTETLISSAQQGAFDESEKDTSASQPAIVVPFKNDMDSSSSSLDMMTQQHMASQQNASGTLLGENVTLSSSADNDPKKDVQSVALTKHNMKMNPSAHPAPKETVNADICSSAAASSLTAGVELNKDHRVMKKSELTCTEINQEGLSTLRKQKEGGVSNEGGGETESCCKEQGVAKSEEPQQVTYVAKAPPVVIEIAEQQPKTSLDDEYTRRSESQSSPGLQEVFAAQARQKTALAHNEQETAQAVSFPDSSLNTTQTSVEMSGLEVKGHFSGLKEMEVEYAMGLESVKNISLECDTIPGHHCVYCAAEFPSRNNLWKHARECRDNHLIVMACHVTGPKDNKVVQKPVSNVPWQVQNDYTKKEAMMMKSEIGIDLNCVIPAVGYRPPNKPEQEPVKNKKRKKKQKSKSKGKEDKEKEKRRKIERKKRRERERLREKLRVQAKLEQLEQKSVKKFKDKEQQKTFRCELCNRAFHSKEKFEKHKVSHVSTSHKKTLTVCVEKLKVGEIEDHKSSELKTKLLAADKLKEKERSKKKHSKVPEIQSVKKKKPKTSKKKPLKEEDAEEFVDVQSLDDKAQTTVKKNLSAKTSQSIVKLDSVKTLGHLTTSSGFVEDIQQADGTNSLGKSKETTWKKNEFGVQFPVVVEVECPDCQMKFSHQSTLDRHSRLHRK